MKSDRNFHLSANTIATQSNPNPDLEFVSTPVYNIVIEHPEGTILWDTGVHPEAANGHWPKGLYDAYPPQNPEEHRLDDDLEKAGYNLNQIDYVFQTHLHMDHAGGLSQFDGADTPVFVHVKELKYAYLSTMTSEGSNGYVLDDFHHDLRWRLVHQDRESYFEDIEFLFLPGHTPGMMGTMIHLDDAGTIIFASDLLEVNDNYQQERPPGPGLVWNQVKWYESVRKVKDLERRHDAQVIYGHDHNQIEKITKDSWP
jgi:glyoxylase-like metal-dependent hydrolase (beta-lactamase superfamily II)